MSNKKLNKETIKKLSKMRKEMLSMSVEYNDLAKSIDLESRIAILDAEIYKDDLEKEYESISDMVDKDHSAYEYIGYCVNSEGAYAWFPSSIC